MTGYRTYIAAIVAALFNILVATGIVLPDWLTQESIVVTINVILGVVTMLFRWLATKEVKK